MAAPATGYTYDDLLAMPEDDGLRREIIHGELFVNPAPVPRHALVAMSVSFELETYRRSFGGAVIASSVDLYLAHDTVVEPDVLYWKPEHVDRIGERNVGPPDLVVEISSPSTRRRDLTTKRELYAEFGIPEYWFIDLQANVIEVYRLGEPVRVLRPGDVLTSPELPGLSIDVGALLA